MISRRKFIKILGAGSALTVTGFFPVTAFAGNKEDDIIKITILSTNDFHSRIDPFPPNDKKFAGMGGLARRSALVKQIREEGNEVLLLDAGDIFQGTPYYNFYYGELELKFMSQIGYDAATIGNHEFDNGIENIAKQLPNANFPFICSNYDFTNTVLAGKTVPYKIFEKSGIKIGVIGLGIELDGLVSKRNFGETKYNDPVEVANKLSSLLKDQGCSYIIALSHLGLSYENDKVSDMVLAQKTRDIDMIIGGHTHTFMEQALLVNNLDNKQVAITQSGWGGVVIGRADLHFSKKYSKNVSLTFTSKKIKKQA